MNFFVGFFIRTLKPCILQHIRKNFKNILYLDKENWCIIFRDILATNVIASFLLINLTLKRNIYELSCVD